MEYKGYVIESQIVCFYIRYFVYGDGFIFEHFKDIESAKKEIDKRIAKKHINDKLDNISQEIGVDKDIIVECIREIFMKD